MGVFKQAKRAADRHFQHRIDISVRYNKDIILNTSDVLDNWFTIEKKDHANLEWYERVSKFSSAFRTSSRLTNATIEGTKEHMIGIAQAILNGKSARYKRCAVECGVGKVYLWSPRNSTYECVVPIDVARRFAEDALRTLTCTGAN